MQQIPEKTSLKLQYPYTVHIPYNPDTLHAPIPFFRIFVPACTLGMTPEVKMTDLIAFSDECKECLDQYNLFVALIASVSLWTTIFSWTIELVRSQYKFAFL